MADRGARVGVTLHRFFLPAGALLGSVVTFPSETSHQIGRVLRLRSGDRVVVLDGSGAEHVVMLETVGRDTIGTIEETRRNPAEPATHLTLYQGLLKGARFDLVLQKCTEVGISRFVPVVTARAVPSEPSTARQSRFESIVREAAEQCGRGLVPQVAAPIRFPDALFASCAAGPTVLCWEAEGSIRLADVTLTTGKTHVSVFVGPEGGFTEDEAATARSAGAHIVSLGPRILRAETAAIVSSALVLARFGEL